MFINLEKIALKEYLLLFEQKRKKIEEESSERGKSYIERLN